MSAVEEFELTATGAATEPGTGTGLVPPAGPRCGGGLFDRAILGHAAVDALRKLDPRVQARNPVMFVVLIGTLVTLAESVAHPSVFAWSVTFCLALTVVFANFAEAVAEGARQGPGRHAAPDALRHRGTPTAPGRERGTDCGRRARQRRSRGL